MTDDHLARMLKRRAEQVARKSDVNKSYPEFTFVATTDEGSKSGVSIALRENGCVDIRKWDKNGNAEATYQWNGTDWTDAGLATKMGRKTNGTS